MSKHVMVGVEMDDGGSRRCLGCKQFVYGSLTELPPGECPTPYKSPELLLAESVAREADRAKELGMWKANHANLVERTALLRQRPDLPVDRLPAFKRMEALQDCFGALEAIIAACDRCTASNDLSLVDEFTEALESAGREAVTKAKGLVMDWTATRSAADLLLLEVSNRAGLMGWEPGLVAQIDNHLKYGTTGDLAKFIGIVDDCFHLASSYSPCLDIPDAQAPEPLVVDLPTFDGYQAHIVRELQAAFVQACEKAAIKVRTSVANHE